MCKTHTQIQSGPITFHLFSPSESKFNFKFDETIFVVPGLIMFLAVEKEYIFSSFIRKNNTASQYINLYCTLI